MGPSEKMNMNPMVKARDVIDWNLMTSEFQDLIKKDLVRITLRKH